MAAGITFECENSARGRQTVKLRELVSLLPPKIGFQKERNGTEERISYKVVIARSGLGWVEKYSR